MITQQLEKTARRETRESYLRFMLRNADISDADAEEYLTTKQAYLENKSLLELVYSGEYEKATKVVEDFVDTLEEENLDELS